MRSGSKDLAPSGRNWQTAPKTTRMFGWRAGLGGDDKRDIRRRKATVDDFVAARFL
jgi:hypothetical protein